MERWAPMLRSLELLDVTPSARRAVIWCCSAPCAPPWHRSPHPPAPGGRRARGPTGPATPRSTALRCAHPSTRRTSPTLMHRHRPGRIDQLFQHLVQLVARSPAVSASSTGLCRNHPLITPHAQGRPQLAMDTADLVTLQRPHPSGIDCRFICDSRSLLFCVLRLGDAPLNDCDKGGNSGEVIQEAVRRAP